MKRVVTQSLLNCCLYFLAAYLISAIHANLKLFQDDPVSGTGLSLELNLMGVIPVLMISIALSIVSYFYEKTVRVHLRQQNFPTQMNVRHKSPVKRPAQRTSLYDQPSCPDDCFLV